MLDDKNEVSDDEVVEFWWSNLTDEERSKWMLAAQSVDVGDAWGAYQRRMSES